MTMQGLHRALGSWRRKVDRFIALSNFSRDKLAEGGLPREMIAVKPNFVDPDPKPGDGSGGFLLFVGRLSGEKGVATLLKAWQQEGPLPPLRIVGDGPMSDEVRQVSTALSDVHWLGQLPLKQVLDLVGSARFLLVPSTCYENFPRVIAESFAKGTPVIASNHGGLAEIVDDGCTGFLFSPGDHSDLARIIVRAWSLGEEEYRRHRTSARVAYERHYTAERNYGMLCEIYRQAIGAAQSTYYK
jgi:glycosyltransferase involved in cell wall biosynthesis